nr:unnamed protein product [Digitaria exilis]
MALGNNATPAVAKLSIASLRGHCRGPPRPPLQQCLPDSPPLPNAPTALQIGMASLVVPNKRHAPSSAFQDAARVIYALIPGVHKKPSSSSPRELVARRVRRDLASLSDCSTPWRQGAAPSLSAPEQAPPGPRAHDLLQRPRLETQAEVEGELGSQGGEVDGRGRLMDCWEGERGGAAEAMAMASPAGETESVGCEHTVDETGHNVL